MPDRTASIEWRWGRWGRLRWLFSADYRRGRRLALSHAYALANDPDHQAKVDDLIRRVRSGEVDVCDHPDHLDALFTAVACPGCQRGASGSE